MGIYNVAAILNAGYSSWPAGSAWMPRLTAVMGGPWDRDLVTHDRKAYRYVYDTHAHEMGHIFGLGHAPCGASDAEPEYPYEGAIVGPARSWDFIDGRFVGRLGERGVEIPADYPDVPPEREYLDLMSYCHAPSALSDYNYQRALLLRQSPDYWDVITDMDDNQVSCTKASSAQTQLVAKSAKIDEPPVSIAITGSVDADGIASVRMVEPTGKPVWPGPKTGDLVLVVLDAGGFELHRQPIRLSRIEHSDGRMGWSARVPYFDDAATVVLRSPDGHLRAQSEISR